MKVTSAQAVKCALIVLNISATVVTVALNVPTYARVAQSIAETVPVFFVQNADFVPIARESFGAKTVTTAETVLMSAIAERAVLNVQMSAKAVLKNAVTVPKWIYARNAETAETV